MPAPPSEIKPLRDCETLFYDPYVRVELCHSGALVRITRTARIHPDLITLRRSFEGVIGGIDRSGRGCKAMLFDTRAPVGRNDTGFEQEMSKLRPRIDRGFTHIAVLVRSAVGVLQIRRWFGEDGVARAAGPDETALLEFLASAQPSHRSP